MCAVILFDVLARLDAPAESDPVEAAGEQVWLGVVGPGCRAHHAGVTLEINLVFSLRNQSKIM